MTGPAGSAPLNRLDPHAHAGGLAELDRLDSEQRRRFRLVLLDLGDELLSTLALEEELEGGLGLRADDAEEEHGSPSSLWPQQVEVLEAARSLDRVP